MLSVNSLLLLMTKLAFGSVALCLTLTGAALTVGSSIHADELAFLVRSNNVTKLDMLDVHRGIRTRLIDEVGPVKPSWSPDGTRIAYGNTVVRVRDSGVAVEGWVELVGVNDGAVRRVLTYNHTILGVEWSPDGELLAVETSSGIHMINPIGANFQKYTDGSEMLWSPDGKENIVVRGFDLFVVNERGLSVRTINSQARLVEADQSPNGRQIVFVTQFYYSTALQIMELGDDSAPQRLLNVDYGCVRNPDWSPDGTHIAFDARCAQPPGIYMVDADSSNLRLLVRANRGEILSQPAWRPLVR